MAEVLERTVGFVVFGDAQDTATMKADVSLDTLLGMKAPTTETLWLETPGMATGLNDAIVATNHGMREENRTR